VSKVVGATSSEGFLESPDIKAVKRRDNQQNDATLLPTKGVFSLQRHN